MRSSLRSTLGPPSIVRIYDTDLDLDRNWKGLWEPLSHSVSSPELPGKNALLTTWLYGCNGPFPRLSLPLSKVLPPSWSGSVCAHVLPCLDIPACNPFFVLNKSPFLVMESLVDFCFRVDALMKAQP